MHRGDMKIRFKFMPTPSAALHVGHAWLVFVMHALVKAVRREGGEAELVLVLDEINMSADGSFDEEVTKRLGREIIFDLQRLDANPDRVVWNGDGQYAELAEAASLDAIALRNWTPGCIRPAEYFLRNALLDAELGVTHVVRGEDRRDFNAIYAECYEKLGCRAPLPGFIPLLRQGAGAAKISASNPYRISALLEKTSADELFCFLAEQCIERRGEDGASLHPVADREAAETRLLGDDWREMLDGEPAATKRFFGRFAAEPLVRIEEGRCVGRS